MQISDIPAELDEVLYRLDLKKPKMCFMNCYLAVMNTLSNDNFEIHYILGTVTTSDGYTFDHALIKWNGNYYDPTLEPQGLHNSSIYSIEKEFSPNEIIQLMNNKFELSHIKEMIDGEKPFWPLVKTKSGEYEFEDA
jgi:hypothetical protein